MLAILIETTAHTRDIVLAEYSGAESVEPPGRLIDHPGRPVDEELEAARVEKDPNQIHKYFFGALL